MSQRPSFELGRILITPSAVSMLSSAGVSAQWLCDRHRGGDWGDISVEARIANERAMMHGGEIGSTYVLDDGTSCYLFTGADRTLTVIVAPEDLPTVMSVDPEHLEGALGTAGAEPLAAGTPEPVGMTPRRPSPPPLGIFSGGEPRLSERVDELFEGVAEP